MWSAMGILLGGDELEGVGQGADDGFVSEVVEATVDGVGQPLGLFLLGAWLLVNLAMVVAAQRHGEAVWRSEAHARQSVTEADQVVGIDRAAAA